MPGFQVRTQLDPYQIAVLDDLDGKVLQIYGHHLDWHQEQSRLKPGELPRGGIGDPPVMLGMGLSERHAELPLVRVPLVFQHLRVQFLADRVKASDISVPSCSLDLGCDYLLEPSVKIIVAPSLEEIRGRYQAVIPIYERMLRPLEERYQQLQGQDRSGNLR